MDQDKQRIVTMLYMIDWTVTSEQEAAKQIGCSVSRLREIQAELDGDHD